MGGDGVEVKYEEVGSSMGGMVRLRRVAASSWAGVSCARVSWAGRLFSARMDGIGPLFVVADFLMLLGRLQLSAESCRVCLVERTYY